MGASAQAESAYFKYEYFKALVDRQKIIERCMKYMDTTHFNIPSTLNLSDKEFREYVLCGLTMYYEKLDKCAEES